MAILTITKENFETEVLNSDKPVLVDFWASWCGPCRMIAPIIDEIANEVKNAKVGKINVDDYPELASRFKVMTIPTLIVFEKGEIKGTSVGPRPKEAIVNLIGLN